MELHDWLVILATLVAPLFAVQVTQYLDRQRAKREEQLRVFKTLMATRAASLDPRHVEALNMIDVVFHANKRPEIEIRRLWKQYLHHLSDKNYPRESWGAKRVELLVDLLHSMATRLGFDFDKTHIQTQSYYPEGYGDTENDQVEIRRALIEILSGKRFLPMWIANIPGQSEQAPPA